MENLRRLADPAAQVEVALVQGGVVSAEPSTLSQGLASLGSVYYEPLWLFYRGAQDLDRLSSLAGKRIAVGADKSGTAALSTMMLKSDGITQPQTVLMRIGGRAAAQLLISGGIDAAFFIADAQSPIIQELFRAKGVRLMSLGRVDAFLSASRHPQQRALAVAGP